MNQDTAPHYIILPSQPYAPLVATRPEVIPLAFMVAQAVGAATGQSGVEPNTQVVKWLDALVGDYTQRADYWWPHALTSDGRAYLLPWARGAFGYLTQVLNQPADMTKVDPLDWCLPGANYKMGMDVLTAWEVAQEQTSTNHPAYGDAFTNHVTRVRTAMQVGGVIADPDKIRRILRGTK